jgi:hypothetical protein
MATSGDFNLAIDSARDRRAGSERQRMVRRAWQRAISFDGLTPRNTANKLDTVGVAGSSPVPPTLRNHRSGPPPSIRPHLIRDLPRGPAEAGAVGSAQLDTFGCPRLSLLRGYGPTEGLGRVLREIGEYSL